MMNRRTKHYLLTKKPTHPFRRMEEVYCSPDPMIDLDFPGFPHGLSRPWLIKPESEEQKITAAIFIKDGEKMQHAHH